jgi:hypothetical protein
MTKHEKLLSDIDAIEQLDKSITKKLIGKTNDHNHIKSNPPVGLMGTTPAANESRNQAKEGINAANSQLPELEKDIFLLRSKVTDDLIIEHLSVVQAINTDIANYKKLINEQRGIIDGMDSGDNNPLHELSAKRENILTDIVLGLATNNDLTELDAEIKKATTDQVSIKSKNDSGVLQAKQTISGLERRMSEAQATVDNLNACTHKIMDAYLMAKASKAADEFNTMALALSEKLTELAALDRMIKTHGQRKNTGLFYRDWSFKIPFIGLDKPVLGCETHDHFLDRVDSSLDSFNKDVTIKVNQIGKALSSQGVSFNYSGF